jgi:Amt family ammonium transporter
MLGNRKGFPGNPMPPHNRTMVMIGACMLWVGWFGFNAGSAVAADSSASMAMLVTHISAAVGALTWMTIEWVKQGKATMIGIATGMVAGLATITPAAGSVGPAGALLIGVMAGYICFYATQVIKGYFYIDDSLDVFPVHGVGGMLGIIMISFLGSPDGFLGTGAAGIAEGGALVQLKAQLIGITVIAAWTGLATYLIIKAISVFTDIRVSEDVEAEGVDINEHNEQGYSF